MNPSSLWEMEVLRNKLELGDGVHFLGYPFVQGLAALWKPEMNPLRYLQLIFDKGKKVNEWKKDSFFNK